VCAIFQKVILLFRTSTSRPMSNPSTSESGILCALSEFIPVDEERYGQIGTPTINKDFNVI